MTTRIRAATPADAAAVGRMHLASWREAYTALLPDGFFPDDAEDRWVRRWEGNLAQRDDAVVLRIAERDGEVLGLATAGPGRANDTAGPPVRDRELWSMYVRASEYGSGLATRLLEAVLPAGEPAELWVFEANPRAIAFYGKHGFTADGARHVFGADLGHQAEVRLVR